MKSLVRKACLICFWAVLIGCSAPDVIVEERSLIASILKEKMIQHSYLNIDGHQLHYVANGDVKRPALVIIHGTPSDWRQYARYLFDENLLQQFYIVVIDRPGWGESVLANNKKIATFQEQAMIISRLAKQLREDNGGQPVLLMGHSLGASMAPQVAIDFPELIDGLLLFAGTLDPSLSSPRWYNYAAAMPVVPYFIGDRMQRANKEIFQLKENIATLAAQLDKLQAHTIVVQGLKDKLVSPKNSRYVQRSFNQDLTQVIELEQEGHLFPMTMRTEVAAWAQQLLNNIRQ